MKRLALCSAALIALTCLSGCYKSNFVYPSKGATANVSETKRSYFAYGLVGPKEPFRADRVCGDAGVASVKRYQSFGDSCITAIALGGLLYGRTTIEVTCGSGTAHNFYLDEQDRVIATETFEKDVPATDFTSDVF